jgi:hypothetical protein
VSEIFQPIEDEWAEAIVRRDIAAAGDILADDFVQSREGGVSAKRRISVRLTHE